MRWIGRVAALLAVVAAAGGTAANAGTSPACEDSEWAGPSEHQGGLWLVVSLTAELGEPCTLSYELGGQATGPVEVVEAPKEGRLLASEPGRLVYVFDSPAPYEFFTLAIPVEPVGGHGTINVIVRAVRRP